MEQLKRFFGLLLISVCLVHHSETIENKVNNEIVLKRVRRIIRGHLAQPGQVSHRHTH